MDKLDRYINSICSKLKGRSEEITIVRQEMKNHLLQSIEELRKQGKSQDESIDIAINKFGQVEILKEQFKKVYTIEKSFSRKIINIAFILLIIGLLCLLFQNFIRYGSGHLDTKVLYDVQDIIKSDNDVSKDKLKALFEENSNKFKFYNKELKYIAVFKYPKNYNGSIDKDSFEDAESIYPSYTQLNTDLKKMGYISNACSGKEYLTINDKWYISVHYITPKIQWIQYGINNILNMFIIICLLSSMILSIISFFLNMYHKRKVELIS
ncbi:permease prefix domain 1-containing protein [Clostridium sp.]|jgi:hypothetical protein|uniref:permease prefix domain 1-containing protein n=1 Tax=Clostridium sp. TaxID=1506 RepID=UPI002FDE473F